MDTQQIGDRLEIRDLVDEYAAALDARSVERLVGVFTADARFDVTQHGSDTVLAVYEASEEIAQIMTLISPFATTMHQMLNHQVRLEGDVASGVTYCSANHLVGDPPSANLEMLIIYRDRYRRTVDGWRIAHRRVVRLWNELHPLVDESLERELGEALQRPDLEAALAEWAQRALAG
jgi:ketosteroid isomerase-like protein